jgi:glucuronoarabinoxylan endo-1,4-beta-xylanase
MEILEERVVPNAATIYWNQVDQVIAGFGASSAFNLNSMTTAQANLFFSQTSGIGLSLLRSQISDTSTSGTSDEITAMQQAQALGATVFSTPWSPPAQWKSNDSVDNGGYLLPADYQNYANLLTDYVLNMKADGINIAAVSIQNEPNETVSYDSCTWTSQQIHDFIAVLGPTFAANNITAKIILPEESGWTFELLDATLADSTTAQYIGIVAGHDYNGTIGPVNMAGAPAGTQLWETETSDFSAFDPTMTSGLTYATQIYDYMTVAQANAWNYWWLVSSNNDNEGLLGEGGATTKRLYTVGNYSKFIRPGCCRISETDDGDGLEISTYKNLSTGQFVIVVVNPNSSATAENFSLNGFSTSSVTPWETSASLNLAQLGAVSVNGSSFNYTFDADSVTTFVGTATTTVATPATPTGVTATPGNAQAALSWTAVSNATSYNVYRSTTSGGEGSTPYATGVTSTGYIDTTVTNGTTYYYEVTAVNTGGESGRSQEVSATPTGPPPSVAFTSTPNISVANESSVTVTGTGVNGDAILVTITDGNYETTAATTTVSGGVWSVTGINASSLAAGAVTYSVTETDSAGDTATSQQTASKLTGPVNGVPSQLLVTVPSIVIAGEVFTVVVDVGDGSGNIVSTYAGAVTIQLNDNPSGGSVGGTLSASAVNGVATFSGLTLNNSGVGYSFQVQAVIAGGTLTATTPTLAVSPTAATPNTQQITAPLSAADAAGNPLSYTVQVGDNGVLFVLQQQFDLMEGPGATNFSFNARGAQEKYLISGNGSNPAGGGYYVLLPNGNLYAWDNVSLAASQAAGPVATLSTYVYDDPTQLTLIALEQRLDLMETPGVTNYFYNARGGQEIYLVSGNGSNPAGGGYYFLLPNANLYAWDRNSLTTSEMAGFVATVPVDAYSDPAQFSNSAPYMPAAYNTQQSLDLHAATTSYFFNARGAHEKYLVSGNGSNAGSDGYYVFMPNGNLYDWVGNSLSSTLANAPVATLPLYYFQNPALLFGAVAPTTPPGLTASISGGNLIVSDSGLLGSAVVYVAASSRTETAALDFVANFSDPNPPTLSVNAANGTGAGTSITTVSNTTSATATLTPSAGTTYSGVQIGVYNYFAIQQQLDLTETPGEADYFYNARGAAEKYLVSGNGSNKAGGGYFVLLPNGNLYAWAGASLATSEMGSAVSLGTAVYEDPAQLTLYAVQQQLDLMETPGATNYFYDVRGGQEKYLVSGNGSNPASGGYYVLLPNGNLYAWDNLSLAATETTVPVASLDVAVYNDPTEITNAAPAYTPAVYNAEQTFDLKAPMGASNYDYNARGADEEYLVSGNGSNPAGEGYYVLMPNGNLYAWAGSSLGASLQNAPVAMLPIMYYHAPAYLISATPPGGLQVVTQTASSVQTTDIAASINGSTLTVSDTAGYLGTVLVYITITDGALTTTQQFQVTFD